MNKNLLLWILFFFVLGFLIGLIILQRVHGDYISQTSSLSQAPTCTPTPFEEVAPPESPPMASPSAVTPTPQTRIDTAAHANNAGQSASMPMRPPATGRN